MPRNLVGLTDDLPIGAPARGQDAGKRNASGRPPNVKFRMTTTFLCVVS
jgi:hypothetical protein